LDIDFLKPEGVCILQQDCPVIIGWGHEIDIVGHETLVIINHQVEVIPFPWIVPEPEIPHKSIVSSIELNECIGR